MSQKTNPVLSERADILYFQIVTHRYLERADEDYLSARLLYFSGHAANYSWAAQQAVEKYLKSALLFRKSKIRQDHDLVEHLKRLKGCDDVSLPTMIEPPPGLFKISQQKNDSGILRDHPFRQQLSQFISQINRNGNTATRYGEVDQEYDFYDIIKFDIICKLLRSLCPIVSRDISGEPLPIFQSFSDGDWKFGFSRRFSGECRYLQAANYAYFPELQIEFTPLWSGIKNNQGMESVYEGMGDLDYKRAIQTLGLLTKDD